MHWLIRARCSPRYRTGMRFSSWRTRANCTICRSENAFLQYIPIFNLSRTHQCHCITSSISSLLTLHPSTPSAFIPKHSSFLIAQRLSWRVLRAQRLCRPSAAEEVLGSIKRLLRAGGAAASRGRPGGRAAPRPRTCRGRCWCG